MAWIERHKSNGKQYIYLKAHTGYEEYRSKPETRIYNFGNVENAVAKLYYWSSFPEKIPPELVEKGFNHEDITKWFETVESRYCEV